MFNFFKKKGAKADLPNASDNSRTIPTGVPTHTTSDGSAPRAEHDVTNDKTSTLRKDVVNLLLPDTDYNQKNRVGAFIQMMAGKRRKNKKKPLRAESVRVSPPKEMKNMSLQRSNSEREPKRPDDVENAKNTQDGAIDDPADFVKALVLQKYANKPPDAKQQHVSLVYVSNPDLDEKRHAEALLREIARSIDCTIDKIIEEKGQMGAADSKTPKKDHHYETIEESNNKNTIERYKSEVDGELGNLLTNDSENRAETKIDDCVNSIDSLSIESPGFVKKSNLKPPKSDTEGCSDDDRSENGKKRVTFRKRIVFDDGDEQTDEELSTFESLSSSEEEEEYLEDLPDNDEFLGGYVVARSGSVVDLPNVEVTEPNEEEGLKRISSDNSDSGFIDDKQIEIHEIVDSEESEESEGSEEKSESETESVTEIEEIIEEFVEPEIVEVDDLETGEKTKSLVSQESRFHNQVAALTELADSRCDDAERTKDLISAYRKEIETKDQEIEQLKCELASAYKESELIRQRSRSLEEDLSAARSCSADLADQLTNRTDETIRQLRAELEDALTHRAELESRVTQLEREKESLERDKRIQEQKAQEALAAAEANTAKWRSAHEAARSQAAARAERMLADCEWKMRDLERKAREADKQNKQLTEKVEQLQSSPPTPASLAELQQLRALVSEQQRSVQALALQLQKVETREEALKLEVHRLKELLDKESSVRKQEEERHFQTIQRLEQQHSVALEAARSAQSAAAASSRAALERAHADRTRAALAQLRAEAAQDARNADRKLRELNNKYESLKEEISTKEAEYERTIVEAHSKADWDIMQLRHMLDKADINYANKVEDMTQNFEREKETLIQEWSEKLQAVEEEAATAAEDAKKVLEATRTRLVAEKTEQVNKLKEHHRLEMEEQWERFMTDKEMCLSRMKLECRQEGEEERVKREKELLEEIAELKSQVQSKSLDFDNLAVKTAACGRTLAVTEQELREALAREKELREKRTEDQDKIKQAEKQGINQIEHLTRKCACLRKLFDDMRARLATRERTAEQVSRAKDKEIQQLKAEVARLTKLLAEEGSPKLGTRTSADGCEFEDAQEELFESDSQIVSRRKGGRTPVLARKRPTLSELAPLPPQARQNRSEYEHGRRRSNSVDLPAVQVPTRIKQLQEKTNGT